MQPMTAKNLLKIGKKSEKRGESGRKDKNWEGSFILPLLTDRAGYATGSTLRCVGGKVSFSLKSDKVSQPFFCRIVEQSCDLQT